MQGEIGSSWRAIGVRQQENLRSSADECACNIRQGSQSSIRTILSEGSSAPDDSRSNSSTHVTSRVELDFVLAAQAHSIRQAYCDAVARIADDGDEISCDNVTISVLSDQSVDQRLTEDR